MTALDDLISTTPTSADGVRALALLPDALLAAGREALGRHDETTALRDLDRVLVRFPASTQAAAVQALLAAPQPVQGTLVRHDGGAVGGALVRLGSHYRPVYGGYETQAPYYVAQTDGHGDFSFAAVPLGDYVLEVEQGDGWTTILTPDGKPRSTSPSWSCRASLASHPGPCGACGRLPARPGAGMGLRERRTRQR